jgi:transposase
LRDTGAAWGDLPDRFPSGSTCFQQFSRWVKTGVLRQILEALARHLEEVGQIDLSECFIDGTFVLAKKGRQSGKDQAGQGYEAHGYCRRFWSSTRCAHGFC